MRFECTVCFELRPDLRLLPCLHRVCPACFGDVVSYCREHKRTTWCVECRETFDPDDSVVDEEQAALAAAEADRRAAEAVNCHAHALTMFCMVCHRLFCAKCCAKAHLSHTITPAIDAFATFAKTLKKRNDELQRALIELNASLLKLSQVQTSISARLAPLSSEIDACFNGHIAELRRLRRLQNALHRMSLRVPSAKTERAGNDNADTDDNHKGGLFGTLRRMSMRRRPVSAAFADDATRLENGEQVRREHEDHDQTMQLPAVRNHATVGANANGTKRRSQLLGVFDWLKGKPPSGGDGSNARGNPRTDSPAWTDRNRGAEGDRDADDDNERVLARRLTVASQQSRQGEREARVHQIDRWRMELQALAKKTIDSDAKTAQLQYEGLDLLRGQCQAAVTQAEHVLLLLSTVGSEKIAMFHLISARIDRLLANKPALDPLVHDTLRFVSFLSGRVSPMVASLDYLGRVERVRSVEDFKSLRFPNYIIDSADGAFQSPTAIASNPQGNLVVADSSRGAVVVVTPAGEVRVAIEVSSPMSVAVGDGGDIWVVCQHRDSVLRYSATGHLISTLAVHDACRVAISPTNNCVLVATMDNVQAYTQAGEHLWTSTHADGSVYGMCVTPQGQLLTGKGYRCLISLEDGSLVRRLSPDTFPAPADIAATSRLFVASDEIHNRVTVYTHDGRVVHRFGDMGGGRGQFNRPRSVAILPDDRIAVADMLRIQLF